MTMTSPRKLLHNYKLKAMALLFAVLSWGIVKQITNNEKVIADVPVVIDHPEGWAVRDREVNTVELTFRGTREDLLLLDERTVQVVVDLRDEEFESTRELEFTSRMVTYTGSNARVTDIQPARMTLRFGMEGRKELPVIVTQSGRPPEGIEVDSIDLEPSVVSLYGAEEVLRSINSLQTIPLSLADRIQSFEQRLDVKPPNEDWVGRISPPRVLARVTLSGLTEERRIPDVPLLIVQPADEPSTSRWRLEPSRVDVFLKASPQLLEELDPEDLQVFVSTRNPDEPERPVQVLAPAGFNVLGVRPETVRLFREPLSAATPAPSSTQPAPAP